MPPYGPTDAQAVQAYWRWAHDMKSVDEVHAEMDKELPGGIGRTTVWEWIQRGEAIEAEHGGPTSRRRAQRGRAASALRRRLVVIDKDIEAGRLKREAGYKLWREVLRDYCRLLGLDAAPPARKVKLTGSAGAPARTDPAVDAALSDPALIAEVMRMIREEE